MSASLRTRYMGLELRSPLVVSACPLSRDVGTVQKMEKAGAGAVVLFSLFEEQLHPAPLERRLHGEVVEPTGAGDFLTRPEAYLEHIRKLKNAVAMPIIASLNASAPGPWLDYALSIERAGADALELDIYRVVTDPTLTAAAVEDAYVSALRQVRNAISIPVAVKLAPYFTNITAIAGRLDEAGASALVLFNRFYQPTIDIERLRLALSLDLSSPAESRLPILWAAILKGQLRADLAVTSGIHGATDVIRALMAGADVAMLCSVLLRYGVDRLADVHRVLVEWLDAHEHGSVEEIRGLMRLSAQESPDDFKRTGYTKILSRYW